MKSFDLQEARQAHIDCPCPYHGTAQCNCQLSVYLVYCEASEPFTLVLHERDGRGELGFVANPMDEARRHKIEKLIRQVLETIKP